MYCVTTRCVALCCTAALQPSPARVAAGDADQERCRQEAPAQRSLSRRARQGTDALRRKLTGPQPPIASTLQRRCNRGWFVSGRRFDTRFLQGGDLLRSMLALRTDKPKEKGRPFALLRCALHVVSTCMHVVCTLRAARGAACCMHASCCTRDACCLLVCVARCAHCCTVACRGRSAAHCCIVRHTAERCGRRTRSRPACEREHAPSCCERCGQARLSGGSRSGQGQGGPQLRYRFRGPSDAYAARHVVLCPSASCSAARCNANVLQRSTTCCNTLRPTSM